MMILADTAAAPVYVSGSLVISTLDGVTTALVAFVLVSLVYPHIIKKRREFFLIVAVVMLVILLHGLAMMIQSNGFTVLAGLLTGVLQIAGIGLAVMSTGGLGAKDLASELSKSYEVMRRGEETKEVIIPIGGAGAVSAGGKTSSDDTGHVVYTIDTPPGPARPAPSDSSIPLDE
ncbi:hypothetical protein BH10PLA1_BH10PLA1_05190 [soil metagenome]